jgi:hypothetical protein
MAGALSCNALFSVALLVFGLLIRPPFGISPALFLILNCVVMMAAAAVYEMKWRSRDGYIVRPPASLIGGVLRFLYSKKAYERVFQPAIVDIREEHAEALFLGDKWRARWICCRGHLCLAVTVVAHAVAAAANLVGKVRSTFS